MTDEKSCIVYRFPSILRLPLRLCLGLCNPSGEIDLLPILGLDDALKLAGLGFGQPLEGANACLVQLAYIGLAYTDNFFKRIDLSFGLRFTRFKQFVSLFRFG